MTLYENLFALTDPNDFSKFFYKDFYTPLGTKVRIFTYNYASYTDWVKPDALEARGIMFEMDGEEALRIMSRPMEKFFNYQEIPFTMDLDLKDVVFMMNKEDGSLISTFVDQGILFTKSKCSISSTQAIESKQILLNYDYKDLHDRCLELGNQGFTCNFEYVSPNNRIVLQYDQRDLVLLNVRENDTGEYVPIEELMTDPVLRKYLVDVQFPETEITEETIEEIRAMTDIEGFIFQMKSGLKFKLKTEWYSALHHMKDSLKNNESLFQVVMSGGSDDIKGLYSDDWSKKKIETFEEIFLTYLKDTSKYIFEFKAELAGLDRKSYAIACQTKLKADGVLELFGLMMGLFKGDEPETAMSNLSDVFMKNYKKHVPVEYINDVQVFQEQAV